MTEPIKLPEEAVGSEPPQSSETERRGVFGYMRAVSLWSKTYWRFLGAVALALVLIWWTWTNVGFKAVWPSLIVGFLATLLFWFSVKVDYLKLIQLVYDSKKQAIIFGEWWIPRGERARQVSISGPRGWVYGPDNEMIYVVSTFDPTTMKGTAHYPDNWTAARVIANLNFAKELIAQVQAVLKEYGAGSAKGKAEWLAAWVAMFAQMDLELYDKETLEKHHKMTLDELKKVAGLVAENDSTGKEK